MGWTYDFETDVDKNFLLAMLKNHVPYRITEIFHQKKNAYYIIYFLFCFPVPSSPQIYHMNLLVVGNCSQYDRLSDTNCYRVALQLEMAISNSC